MCFAFMLIHRHFLMSLLVRLKKSLGFLRFLEYLWRMLLISSYNGLHLRRFPGHFSKSLKYVTKERQWIYTSIFKIFSSCGLRKLWVSNTYHLTKILIFRQLPPKHLLRQAYLDTNDCFFHTSRKTFSLPLRGFHLHLKQWMFFFILSTYSQKYF